MYSVYIFHYSLPILGEGMGAFGDTGFVAILSSGLDWATDCAVVSFCELDSGGKPGGTGSSSRGTGFPLICDLIASANCLQILPYLRALEVLPSASAATFVLLYTSKRSLRAPSISSRPSFACESINNNPYSC